MLETPLPPACQASRYQVDPVSCRQGSPSEHPLLRYTLCTHLGQDLETALAFLTTSY